MKEGPLDQTILPTRTNPNCGRQDEGGSEIAYNGAGAVYETLKARLEAQGLPREGWVFPTGSASGHLEQSVAKIYHAKALAALANARKENPELPEITRFEPYTLRHTTLTNLGTAGVDIFTLARIAGHSRISTTERYIHP